jgi:hypothetical protein
MHPCFLCPYRRKRDDKPIVSSRALFIPQIFPRSFFSSKLFPSDVGCCSHYNAGSNLVNSDSAGLNIFFQTWRLISQPNKTLTTLISGHNIELRTHQIWMLNKFTLYVKPCIHDLRPLLHQRFHCLLVGGLQIQHLLLLHPTRHNKTWNGASWLLGDLS